MFQLQVMNREQVEALSKRKFKPHTLLISIHDYGEESAEIKHFPEFFTGMEFNDVDGDIYLDAYGKSLSLQGKKAAEAKYHPLDSYQAEKLAKFYFHVKDKAEIVICQCEHGQSRSAAVAAAIAEYENKDGLRYFVDDKYCPNKFVFRKIYNALCKESEKINTPQKPASFVSIDIETTGLGESAEIIEIGAVKCECGTITDCFQTFVACASPISEAITSITGISAKDLIGAPDVKTALTELKYFIGDMPLIGYNIKFDMAFIKRYGSENGISFENEAIDVLALARTKLQNKSLSNYKLSTVAMHFGMDFVPHKAIDDAKATLEIYNKLRMI